jgi:hypothetical protein
LVWQCHSDVLSLIRSCNVINHKSITRQTSINLSDENRIYESSQRDKFEQEGKHINDNETEEHNAKVHTHMESSGNGNGNEGTYTSPQRKWAVP